jgi:hypothetical protein
MLFEALMSNTMQKGLQRMQPAGTAAVLLLMSCLRVLALMTPARWARTKCGQCLMVLLHLAGPRGPLSWQMC